MKILTVCLAGAVRSVAMAKALEAKGFIAEAGGVMDLKTQEFHDQMKWADKIIVMDANLLRFIPEKWSYKTTLGNVGGDRWGYHGHPELVGKINKIVALWEKAGWDFHPIR